MAETRNLNWRLRFSSEIQGVSYGTPSSGNIQDWPTADPNEIVTVEMSLSFNDYKKIASSVDVGRDIAYPDESVLVWATWAASFVRAYIDAPEPQQQLMVSCLSTISDTIEFEDENRMYPRIEYVNGLPYLELDCGCGERKYYSLTEASVDPASGAPLPESGGAGTSAPIFPQNGVSGTTERECYTDKAVAYLVDRFIQYVQFVTNLQVTAIDALSQNFDEVADVVATLADITNSASIVQDIRDLGVAQIESVVRSSQVQDGLVDGWNFFGPVSRPDLIAWVNESTPLLVSGVAVRPLMVYWLTNSIIPGYNDDLSRFANECQQGTNINPAPLPNLIPLTIDGVNYELVKVSGIDKTYTFDQGVQTVSFFGFRDCLGLLAYVEERVLNFPCGAGNPAAWLDNAGVRDHQLSNLSIVTSGNWYLSGPANSKEPIENAIGATIAEHVVDTSLFNSNNVKTDASCLGSPDGQLTLGDVFVLVAA